MVEPNKNFVVFLTLFVLSFSLPKFLLLFGVKLHFMLFMLLITFPVLSSKIKLYISAFLGHLQIIITFALSVLLVSFFFSHMSITNLSLNQGFVVFLAMAKLKRDISVMILSLIVFVSHFRAYLSSSSVLDLFPDEAHIPFVIAPDPLVVAHDSPIDFSIQPQISLTLFLVHPLMNRSKMSYPTLSLGPLLLLRLKILHKTFHLIT